MEGAAAASGKEGHVTGRKAAEDLTESGHNSKRAPRELRKGEGARQRDRQKAEERVGRQVGPNLQRLLASRAWTYVGEHKPLQIFNRKLRGGSKEVPKVPKSRSGADPPPRDALNGFTWPEIEEAVAAIKALKVDGPSQEDPEGVREAVGFLREATAEGGEAVCRQLLKLYAVRPLLQLLRHADVAVVEDAVMIFSNTLKHPGFRTALTNEGLLLPLLAVLKATPVDSIRAQVAGLLPLLVRGKTDAVTLRSSGAIPVLIDMLRVPADGEPLDSPSGLLSPDGIGEFPSSRTFSTDTASPCSSLASPFEQPSSWRRSHRSLCNPTGSLRSVPELDVPSDCIVHDPNGSETCSGDTFHPDCPGGLESHESSQGPLWGMLTPRKGSAGGGTGAIHEAGTMEQCELTAAGLQAEVGTGGATPAARQCSYSLALDTMRDLELPVLSLPSARLSTQGPGQRRKPALTIDTVNAGDLHNSSRASRRFANRMPLYEDSCKALAQLVKLETVCVTLLEKGAVRHLVQLAQSSEGEGLEGPILTILQHVAKAKGGAEALCIADAGSGALLLTRYASQGLGEIQQRAMDVLLGAASNSEPCAQALKQLNVVEK